MEELKPQFENKVKFVWTDSADAMSKRHTIGITWDELPAIGINASPTFVSPFPKGEVITKANLVKWLEEVTSEKTVQANAQPIPSQGKPDPQPTSVNDEL